MRILLVDDDPVLAELLKFVLRDRGHEVEAATDGSRALQAFQNSVFDLVITDMMLPEMDGSELARKIKELRPAQNIVLLSGNDFDGGPPPNIDHVLTKPVDFPKLHRILKAVETGAQPTS